MTLFYLYAGRGPAFAIIGYGFALAPDHAIIFFPEPYQVSTCRGDWLRVIRASGLADVIWVDHEFIGVAA